VSLCAWFLPFQRTELPSVSGRSRVRELVPEDKDIIIPSNNGNY